MRGGRRPRFRLDAMRRLEQTFGLRARSLAAAAACGLLLLAPAVLAQNAPAPVAPVQSAPLPDATPAVPAVPRPVEKPGLFEAIGRWIDRGNDSFRDHLRGARRRIDDAADDNKQIGDKAADIGKGAVDATKGAVEATRGAVDAVARLPGTRVIKGHERCGVAPNGAPDCVAAADALCRKQGFSSGKSLDFTSAEECSARVLLSGRQSDNDCTIVTFISRAVCQ
jgi:hypothetical protein